MMRLLSRKWFAAAMAAALASALVTGCSGGPAAPAAVTPSPSAAVTSAPPATVSTPPLPTASAVGSAGPSGPANGTIDFGPDAVSFVSATQGWALAPGDCGHCGIVYRTADAGRHWRVLATPTLPGGAQALAQGSVDLSFADGRDGYVFTGYHCASDCLLVTHDGGRSWHAVALTAVVDLVVASDHAYALTSPAPRGDLLLRRSPVGSDDWMPVALPVASPQLQLAARADAIALLRPGKPFAIPGTDLGGLWYSAGAGGTWSARPNPCRTTDGGAALVSLALGHPAALLVDCFDDRQSEQEQQTRHHLYGSADTGRTWVRLADPTHIGAPVLMADNGAGHAFLATESGGRNILAATLDGAAHWHTAITARPGFFGWGDLRFVSARVGFVLGPTHYAREHLYRTTDGGRSWQQLPLPGPAG